MLVADEETKRYFEMLNKEVENALERANRARKRNIDPVDKVEVSIANDLGERVEGLLGLKGLKEVLKEMEKQGMKREEIAFELTKRIARGEIIETKNREEAIDKAIRIGVAILTEGVLVAPTEGISKVVIKKNDDGSEYLSVYYAGPIRSAGGTVAALSVVLADLARRENNISRYKPTPQEVNRIIEEVNIYDARAARLQYKPPEEHVKIIVEGCPVCVEGDPTEEIEVSVNRDLPRIETNRIRGGVPLVLCEGIAQKSQKISKYIASLKLDGWEWIKKVVKVKKEEKEKKVEIKPDPKYLDGVVAGRPIFAYPSAKGGFRLRYGRARTNSLMAKGIHPATMVISDYFLANGTHIKLERPGKGAVVSAVDGIEGPIVKLRNGDVVKLNSAEEAEKLREEIEEILFLGDMLTTFGDFLKTNTPLLPSPYVEEWWIKEAKQKGIEKTPESAEEAFEISRKYGIPLYPKYLYYWGDISKDMLIALIKWLKEGEINKSMIKVKRSISKRVLELAGVEHKVREGFVIIEGDVAYSLIETLGLDKELNLEEIENSNKEVLEILSEISGVKIMHKSPTYIGARMGRPEKAKERTMKPPIHVLFPTGDPKVRELNKIYNTLKARDRNRSIEVEIATYRCTNCKSLTFYPLCHKCNKKAVIEKTCVVCGKKTTEDIHCKKPTVAYSKRRIDFIKLYDEARRKLNINVDVKGVKGLMSKDKIPERMEKGLIRAKYGVYVFRDGTARFDASNVPLTHFTPKEVGVSVERLKELGYATDHKGEPLEREDQIVPLKVQDIVISKRAANYLFNVSKFIDEMLINLYGEQPYYNLNKKEDLIGHLVIALAPHISTGVVGRIIGISEANVFYAHPFMHTAKRRNCDGDEDSIMLIMDAFLNFSKKYLSDSRGGTMDSPLILTLNLDPKEVDDESHNIEIEDYSLEFYKSTLEYTNPGKVKIKTVADVLGSKDQYKQLPITHYSSCIDCGNNITTYKKLNSVPEKLDSEIKLMKKIRAIDLKDAIEKIIINHFIPDIYGNLRKFSRQKFRCVNCQEKYRRVPLKGVCLKCGGNLTLTIHKGGIEKYLLTTIKLAEEYNLSLYLRQRLKMVKEEIRSLFEDEKVKQMAMFDYM